MDWKFEKNMYPILDTRVEFKKNDKLVDSPSAAYIYRIQCPNLWDCIGTNIIRQVIRASQAKNMYRTFSEYVG